MNGYILTIQYEGRDREAPRIRLTKSERVPIVSIKIPFLNAFR